MKIIIEPCKNGAYVIYDDGENEDRFAYKFEEDSLDGLQELLSDVHEYLGFIGSKYDRERIYIKREHGYDYECKGCELCGEVKRGKSKKISSK